MAALRTGLANERSANIDETHSRLDEHHVERLWVGVSVSENTPSETFSKPFLHIPMYSPLAGREKQRRPGARRPAPEGRQARQGAAEPPPHQGAGHRRRRAGGHLPRSRFGLEGDGVELHTVAALAATMMRG